MNVRPSQLYSALLLLQNIYCSFKIWSVHFMFTMNADTRGVTYDRQCGVQDHLWSYRLFQLFRQVVVVSAAFIEHD